MRRASFVAWTTGALGYSTRLTEASAYNVSLATRIRGEVDLNALRRAFTALVQRHSMLRARFPSGDGGPVCVVSGRPGSISKTQRIGVKLRCATVCKWRLRPVSISRTGHYCAHYFSGDPRVSAYCCSARTTSSLTSGRSQFCYAN